jgi:putative addiction module component (TIGR02574 family)
MGLFVAIFTDSGFPSPSFSTSSRFILLLYEGDFCAEPFAFNPRSASTCQVEETALGWQAYERFADQINSLSAAEKAELLDTVWESLEADAVSLTDAQRAELDYRITRHEQNPSDVIPWQQVRAGLFKKP